MPVVMCQVLYPAWPPIPQIECFPLPQPWQVLERRVRPARPGRLPRWGGSVDMPGNPVSRLRRRCGRKPRCVAEVAARGKMGGSKCESSARPAQMCHPPGHRGLWSRANNARLPAAEYWFQAEDSYGPCSWAHNTNNECANLSANTRQKKLFPPNSRSFQGPEGCTAKSAAIATKYWIGP